MQKFDNNEKTLLTLIQSNPIPAYRQAYSDRTAWLMARLSDLAYEDFARHDPKNVNTAHKIDENRANNSEVQKYDFNIEATYDRKVTQAILVSTDTFIALAFRGTQGNMEDIIANIKANKKQTSNGGAVHSGYNDALEEVRVEIQYDLNKEEFANKPLFITGHSMGGALATIAAKRLEHKGGIAACYTFGAPRVGDEEWAYGIKTPIYRVVNAMDVVPTLPPYGLVLNRITLVLLLIPRFGRLIRQFILEKFGDYHHVGDMRYLTSCKLGNYEDVRLLTTVPWRERVQRSSMRKNKPGSIKDHSRAIYKKKLAIIALRHNEG